ncbi:MAG TPA: class I SAM-dependent methyltransferase [Thermoanaerobaculia bacterium]|jgi:SAM-dependent methyltransferase|nr:class I SAM-dependent methyltransferase [Thermoanaerobaculia bacterium]
MSRLRGVIRKQVQRGRNAVRRLRSGLPLYAAENVSPEVPNDLFQAHLSIYHFFARFVAGRRVLDIGCGTGYGTAYLLRSGARAVVGVDQDRRSIAYARSHYAEPGLEFLVGDAEVLPPELGTFGTVVSSNVFEHLHDPARALERVRRHLLPEGQFLLVVPPILDEASLAANRANPFHRSNLFVWEWTALLSRCFGQVRAFRHLPPPGSAPSFTDPFPSSLTPADFEFLEVPAAELGSAFTLGAVFLCSEPHG